MSEFTKDEYFKMLCSKYGIIIDDCITNATEDLNRKEIIFDSFCFKGATCSELEFIRKYLEQGTKTTMYITTSSVLNRNHCIDSYIREKFEEAMHQANPALKYCENDVRATQEMMEIYKEKIMRPRLRIKNVIFNDPATIVFWFDGTKTVVKCQPGDTFDPEKGLAMAICKKLVGTNDSQSNFNDIFKKWLPKEEKKESKVLPPDPKEDMLRS